jgi:hypothetical protein
MKSENDPSQWQRDDAHHQRLHREGAVLT